MSKTVQIRDLPDEVHRTLRARAAQAGVSLSDYLREELSRIAARPPLADVLSRAGSRHGGASVPDIVTAVRDSRRHAG